MARSKKPRPTSQTIGLRLDQAPMAVTSSGAILINAARLQRVDAPEELLKSLANERGVFIGVLLRPSEAERALLQLEDATAEIGAVIGGLRARRRARR